jgi:hypothetical protein
MPRPVSIRVSYREDASFLLRLEAAIVKDTSQSEGWRKDTAQKIRHLALCLLEADKSKHMFGRSKAEAPKAPVVKRAMR